MPVLNIEGIEIEIIRKRIKNLNLRVLPPDGSVRATAPLGMSEKKIIDFIRSKEDWIRKQQTRISERDYEEDLQFVSGEEHYLFGKKYPLLLKDNSSKEGVSFSSGTILLYCRPESVPEQRAEIIDRWYRENLLTNLPGLISKWEDIMGVKVREYRVRKMKTRWGTCNPKAARIWISLMLAKRRPELVEYIVVHEMVHLLERGHNKRFYALMDKYLPGWKELRKELK